MRPQPGEQARKLHREAIIIDNVSFFCEGYSDYLAGAGVTALNITVPDIQDDEAGALRNIASYYRVIRDDPKMMLIETADDILRAKREGRCGIIIGFQNARPLNYDVTMVELFYRMGTRIVQLTYNDRNFAADGCDTDSDAGLSREGRELIREMNRVGMLLDLSHVGERSALDALEATEQPPVFTHSNPRSRCPVPRNITDEMIRMTAEKRGVIGLTPYAPMNWTGGDVPPTMDDFLDNIEYVIDLVGIDHVAVGTDSEATVGAYPREVIRRLGARFSKSTGYFKQRFPAAGKIEGFASMADFPVFTQALLDRGLDEESVRKILGLNMVRVFREVWK